MSPILNLNWDRGVAYGPRGCQYVITPNGQSGLFQVHAHAAEGSERLGYNLTQDEAMIEAQNHANGLAELYGRENDAINGTRVGM